MTTTGKSISNDSLPTVTVAVKVASKSSSSSLETNPSAVTTLASLVAQVTLAPYSAISDGSSKSVVVSNSPKLKKLAAKRAVCSSLKSSSKVISLAPPWNTTRKPSTG